MPDTAIDVRWEVIRALADAEGLSVSEIEARIVELGGDAGFELDSKFAEAVIAVIAEQLGRRLKGPADLPRTDYSTIDALVYLVSRQVS